MAPAAPHRWLELTVRAPLSQELVPPVLLEMGGAAVEEREGDLVTYVPPPPDREGFLEALRSRLAELGGAGDVELSWRWQPHQDWTHLWRTGLGIRRVTPRILVAPSWEAASPGPGEHLIVLDPGMAFGTAEHATTRGCLRLLDRLLEPGARVADVGAGSGILSIAAALLGAGRVLALEMDGPSCATARENARRNGVENTIHVVETRVSPEEDLPDGPFQGIVGNLQSFLLLPLLPVFHRNLEAGGWAIVSGILLEERKAFLEAAMAGGWALVAEDQEEDWWSGALVPVS